MCIANTQASSIIMLRSFRIYVFAEKKQDGLISDSTFISVYLIYLLISGEGAGKTALYVHCHRCDDMRVSVNILRVPTMSLFDDSSFTTLLNECIQIVIQKR